MFVILPRKQVYPWCRYRHPKQNFAIISIFDSDKSAPVVPANPWMQGFLKVQFDDCEPADLHRYADLVLFTEEMANTIWDYVLNRAEAGIKMWAVHCEMGSADPLLWPPRSASI